MKLTWERIFFKAKVFFWNKNIHRLKKNIGKFVYHIEHWTSHMDLWKIKYLLMKRRQTLFLILNLTRYIKKFVFLRTQNAHDEPILTKKIGRLILGFSMKLKYPILKLIYIFIKIMLCFKIKLRLIKISLKWIVIIWIKLRLGFILTEILNINDKILLY